MDINRSSMEILFKGFNSQFKNGLGLAPDSWKNFAGVIPSSTAANVYPFLEQLGGMREWLGDRQIKNISSQKLEVANRDFEDTVSVKRNDIEDDQYGIYGTLIAQMGQNAGKLWQDLASDELVSDKNWLDGESFFSDSRTYGSSIIENMTGSALNSTTFESAYQAMVEYAGHSGKSLGVIPNLLIVGPKNRKTAWDIVENTYVSDGETSAVQVENANRNLVEMLVLPELSGDYDDYWFLAQTSKVLKPVIIQQRQLPKLTRMDRDTDENVFMRKEFLYGTDARGAAFLSFPHLIYRGGSSV